jgi:hypothetical protein
MIIIETFKRGCSPRTHPAGSIRMTRHDDHRRVTKSECPSFFQASAGHGGAHSNMQLGPQFDQSLFSNPDEFAYRIAASVC